MDGRHIISLDRRGTKMVNVNYLLLCGHRGISLHCVLGSLNDESLKMFVSSHFYTNVFKSTVIIK